MAVTYTWTIANCEHDIATGGITRSTNRNHSLEG